MDNAARFQKQLDDVSAAFQTQLHLKPAPLDKLVARSKGRLPTRIRRDAQALIDAKEFADHPKLSRTLDFTALGKSADHVVRHLKTIDLEDERKGRWLSLAGSLSINLISVFILLIAVLMWRGFL